MKDVLTSICVGQSFQVKMALMTGGLFLYYLAGFIAERYVDEQVDTADSQSLAWTEAVWLLVLDTFSGARFNRTGKRWWWIKLCSLVVIWYAIACSIPEFRELADRHEIAARFPWSSN